MTYYRVKKDYDNCPKFVERPNHQLRQTGILVGDELYTPAERAKIMNRSGMFEEVQIPKNKIYFFFGARFEFKGTNDPNEDICPWEV